MGIESVILILNKFWIVSLYKRFLGSLYLFTINSVLLENGKNLFFTGIRLQIYLSRREWLIHNVIGIYR